MIPVLIPILNGRNLTKDCIRSVIAQDVPTEIWVIDNGSQDGSGPLLRSMPQVNYVPANMPSVAASWNMGLRYLFNMHERVLVLNNDLVLRPDTARLLLEEKADFVTCVSRDSRDCLTEPLLPKDKWNRRPRPDFSCFVISRATFRKVGSFDERFIPAYGEDGDWHIRAHRKGVRPYCIDVPFYHAASQTINLAPPKQQRHLLESAEQNRRYFTGKHGCRPGTEEYESLFDDRFFGIDT